MVDNSASENESAGCRLAVARSIKIWFSVDTAWNDLKNRSLIIAPCNVSAETDINYLKSNVYEAV